MNVEPQFRAAHAGHAQWHTAAQNCLMALAPLPPGANLGFLYVTDVLAPALDDILAFFKSATHIDQWVGTVGIGVMGRDREYFEQPAMSVMVGGWDAGAFRVFGSIRADVRELFDTESQSAWCTQHNARFGIVHGDPRNTKTPALIGELSAALDGGYLVGGITSSRGPHAQIAGEVTTGGLSGVLFAGDVPVVTALTQGCTPLEPMHTVTECRDNIVIEIDGRPALDVLKEDIGEVLARDLARAAGYIFVGLPIRGSDTGDYLVRNLIGVDPRNKVIAIGEYVQPGDSLMFCRRDANTAREDLQRMLTDIKRRAGGAPRAGVYYSCLGRGPHMFGAEAVELNAIARELGEFPLVGFYANGEISHNRLYGYTGVLTLFL